MLSDSQRSRWYFLNQSWKEKLARKKWRDFVCFWWKRGEGVRLLLLSMGGWERGTFLECSFDDIVLNLANQSASAGCIRRLHTPVIHQWATSIIVPKANEIPVRKRDPGAIFSRYFINHIYTRLELDFQVLLTSYRPPISLQAERPATASAHYLPASDMSYHYCHARSG